MGTTPKLSERTASFALLFGGAMWGLYWIPVRLFEERGLTGPWPGIVMYLAAALLLVPFVWRARRNMAAHWRTLLFSGLFTGAALSLYTTSLVYTDIARSILLFYLTPVWGTLLGLLFLRERLGPKRLVSLALGLLGLFVVLGNDRFMPWPRNVGDWLALASGLAWAFGSLGLYRARATDGIAQVGAFVLGALAVSAVGVLVTWGRLELEHETLIGWPIPLMALLAGLYVVPMIFLTIWPATVLTPARVGLLLMSEVVVGLFSAALFSGDPFGWQESVGATLIVSAAAVEIYKS